ncbi:MAG: hypothetical protein PVH19_08590 [Planctomycetia bacterium]|jgi:hypothetical protein
MNRSIINSLAVVAALFALAIIVWPDGQTGLIDTAQAQKPATTKTSDENQKRPEISRAERENLKTLQKLEQKIDCDFLEHPLNEILLSVISEATKTQVYIDHKSIEETGFSLDTPITFNLKGLPARMALRLILDKHYLGYYLDNGIIVVTSKHALGKRVVIRMYDVTGLLPKKSSGAKPRKILSPTPNTVGHVNMNRHILAQFGSPAPVGIPAGGDGKKGSGHSSTYTPSPEEELIDMITNTIEPDSWMGVGGEGSLSCFRGILVVRQTEAVQEKIGELLDQLSYMLNGSPLPKSTPKIDPKLYCTPNTTINKKADKPAKTTDKPPQPETDPFSQPNEKNLFGPSPSETRNPFE